MLTSRPGIQNYAVIIPTLNAASHWPRFAPALLACVSPDRVLIVDSESTDGTPELARAAGFGFVGITRRKFDHGGTRQWATQFTGDAEILVFLTQDAVLADPSAIAELLTAFQDPAVAAAYGRQLPRPEAGAIEAHARHFSYPVSSDVRDLPSRERLGIRTIRLSNSFAAYRRSALMAIGGFPAHVIWGEDMVVAGHLLLSGHKMAYVAEARAYHSHPLSWAQEFRRYFDIGVLFSRESRVLDQFGRTNGEGKRFVLSELKYLFEHDALQIPIAMARTASKLVGYRLGRMEARLAPVMKRRLSAQPSFWSEAEAPDAETKI
jgi:rhamnosyltransferase